MGFWETVVAIALGLTVWTLIVGIPAASHVLKLYHQDRQIEHEVEKEEGELPSSFYG